MTTVSNESFPRPDAEVVRDMEEEQADVEYNSEILAEVEPMMSELVVEMKEKLQKNNYQTLISDEVSARTPTLVLREVMKEFSEDKQESPETYFISGGSQLLEAKRKEEEKLIEFLKEKCKGKNTLLVTEYISSGQTVLKLVEMLKKAGVEDFDVASMMVSGEKISQKLQKKLKKENINLFVGKEEVTKGALKIWEKGEYYAGVEKDKNLPEGKYDLHPSKIENVKDNISSEEAQERRNRAREDIKLMAAKIIKELE